MDETIQFLLQKLDPHSYYISAAEIKAMSEPLEGSFEGIGVQFSIQKDTIVVVSPVEGGPSAELGIQSGDRIVNIDSQLVAGNGITNSMVMKLLKGPAGTEVNVGIKRATESQLVNYNITRGKIPIHSIDIGYMINDSVGYIKVSRFSKTTIDEFRGTSRALISGGMKSLILDLRGNGGGYMDAAVKMADEFLEENKLIVYTEGRSRPKQKFFATSEGSLQSVYVVVLIDEGSASASEIVAGAIQDNDRGLIMGRRSFGKGLVQEQSSWPDGSATRLTVARYYTPSGRCIQRPYEEGTKAYHKELSERYENGEMMGDLDSLAINDSLEYTTIGGRTVYGGGGIMPDVFIPIDTAGGSLYLSHLYYANVIYSFCFEYADLHRNELESFEFSEFSREFKLGPDLEKEFLEFAQTRGVPFDKSGYLRSKHIIHQRVKAGIGRNIFGDKVYYPIVNELDKTIKAAQDSITSKQL